MGPVSRNVFINCRVTPSIKARVRAAAVRQGLTESALVTQCLAGVVGKELAMPAPTTEVKVGRSTRLYVRLEPKDLEHLRERALARLMPAATYVSVLVRAHLHHIAPLPKTEYLALRRSLTELSAIGRNLNQLARATNQGVSLSALSGEDMDALLRVTHAVRDEVQALLIANERSWIEGERRTPSGPR
jgi:Bacterial mobilisation protein (MobC)